MAYRVKATPARSSTQSAWHRNIKVRCAPFMFRSIETIKFSCRNFIFATCYRFAYEAALTRRPTGLPQRDASPDARLAALEPGAAVVEQGARRAARR